MPQLHLFNPENDIALAAATANFTPPRAAVELRNAGQALPLWYTAPGDRVLCSGINARWLDDIRNLFGIDADVFDHTSANLYEAAPWGWSPASRRQFLDEGFSPDTLPSDSQLAKWREISHRRTAAAIRDVIAPSLDFDIAPAAVEIHSSADLQKILASQPNSIIKSPWSSSGRGLIDTRRLSAVETLRRCEGILRRQGSVMVELAYTRIADFALLFTCHNGKCNFSGYSFFNTDDSGNYTGNMLAPDKLLLEKIGEIYPAERITVVSDTLRRAIDDMIAPHYDGPLGVDMLVAHTESGTNLLDATVELNLRMTMGFVAHTFANRYLAEGSIGSYSVTRCTETPVDDNITVDNRRLISGRMMLTPPGGTFRFAVETHTL